jgi:hypothetical protein
LASVFPKSKKKDGPFCVAHHCVLRTLPAQISMNKIRKTHALISLLRERILCETLYYLIVQISKLLYLAQAKPEPATWNLEFSSGIVSPLHDEKLQLHHTDGVQVPMFHTLSFRNPHNITHFSTRTFALTAEFTLARASRNGNLTDQYGYIFHI